MTYSFWFPAETFTLAVWLYKLKEAYFFVYNLCLLIPVSGVPVDLSLWVLPMITHCITSSRDRLSLLIMC